MTFLHSLISGPRAVQETERAFTDATSLAGGRFAAQVGDFVEVGLHAVSAHQTNSVADQLVETLHKGSLTNEQNQTVGQIEILLKDDSPEDGRGGAAFFPDASDVIITYRCLSRRSKRRCWSWFRCCWRLSFCRRLGRRLGWSTPFSTI